MATTRSSVRSTAVMRLPCVHSEPEALAVGRVRAAGVRAVWVAYQRCKVIAAA